MRLSLDDHVAAVTRSLSWATFDGEPGRLLTLARAVDAAPPEVWTALTDAERVGRWLVPLGGDLETGGRFELAGLGRGEVLGCDEPERLSLTWEAGSDDDHVGRLDVSLRPLAAGTLVQLDHTDPVPAQKYDEFGPGAVGIGWEMALMGLAEHLLAPDVDPRADLAGLPGLRGYVAAAADAWREAAVRAGDDPDAAREAAERCRAAYSG